MQPQQSWLPTNSNYKNSTNINIPNLNLQANSSSQNRRASPNVLDELQTIQQQNIFQQNHQQQQQKMIQSFSAPTTPTNLSTPSSPVNTTPLHQAASKMRKRKRDRITLNMSAQDGDWVFKNETKESIMNPESYREPVVTREIPSNLHVKSNASGEFEVLHWRINKSQQQFQQQLLQHLNSQQHSGSLPQDGQQPPSLLQQQIQQQQQQQQQIQQQSASGVSSHNQHDTAISKLISKLATQQPSVRRNSAPAPYHKPPLPPSNSGPSPGATQPVVFPTSSTSSESNGTPNSITVNWEQMYREQAALLQQVTLEKQKLEEQLYHAKCNWDQLLEQTNRREETIQSQQQQINSLRNTLESLVEKGANGTLIRKSISLQQLSHNAPKLEDISSKLVHDFQQLSTSGASSRSSTPSTTSSGVISAPSSLSNPSSMTQASLLHQHHIPTATFGSQPTIEVSHASTSSAASLLFPNNEDDEDMNHAMDSILMDNPLQPQTLQSILQQSNSTYPQNASNSEQEPVDFIDMILNTSSQHTPNFFDGLDMNYFDVNVQQQKRRKMP